MEYWVAQVRPGTMLFEVGGVPKELAFEAFDWLQPSYLLMSSTKNER